MKISAVVFLIAIVGSSLSLAQGAPAQSKTKVLILGAGVAGITAAKTLHDKGIDDFLVLEGQDYIGGRIRSVPFAGLKVEKGANWIHESEEDDPITTLKTQHKLSGSITDYEDMKMRDDEGNDVTDHDLLEKWDVTMATLFKMSSKRRAGDRPDMPVAVGLNILGWKSNTPLKQALSWLYLDLEYGNNEDETSLKNLPEDFSSTDLFLNDPRGYWSLFEDFYSDFPEKILLNKTVTKIQYSSEGVLVTAGGQDFRADYALSTFSNGVLASDLVEFEPPLPTWKKEAIYRMRMSYYTKIFLKFPRDFWDDSEWILHVSKTRGYYSGFLDFDRPGYLNGSGILLVSVTGEMSLKVENQDDSQTLEEIMAVLRGMYGDGIPNATEILVSKWSRNRFTQGSFSDPVIGTSDETFENIAGRLDRLFFAGEGTIRGWYSTVQGGYYSGKGAARALASCINGKTCEEFVPATRAQRCETSAAARSSMPTSALGLSVALLVSFRHELRGD